MFDQLKATSLTSSSSPTIGKDSSRMQGRPYSFALVLAAALVMVLSVGSNVARGDDDAGAKAFKANCVVCHGADGTGTATGKALKAPDLNSDAVRKLTEAEIVKQISDGKNNMPPFKNTLTKDQISALATYVHTTFGKKK